MNNHPISDLMSVTMQKIREMVDVNTIIGQPIPVAEGVTIIPISKVTFGFASGGTDYQGNKPNPPQEVMFGGGSGAGITISPVSFLIVSNGNVKLLQVSSPANSTVDRIVELVPEVIDKVGSYFNKNKAEEEMY